MPESPPNFPDARFVPLGPLCTPHGMFHIKDQVAHAAALGVTVRTVNGAHYVDLNAWRRAEEHALGVPVTDPEEVRERLAAEQAEEVAALKRQMDGLQRRIEALVEERTR